MKKNPAVLRARSWSRRLAGLLMASVFWGVLNPCQIPTGEKMIPPAPPGGGEFRMLYWAAWNGWHGGDPWEREPETQTAAKSAESPSIERHFFPSSLVLVMPLTALFKSHTGAAAIAWYFLNLVMLLGLAWVGYQIGQDFSEGKAEEKKDGQSPLYWALFIPLCFPALFALDRGSTDILQAFLFWSAAWLVAKNRLHQACALALLGTCFKGYGTSLTLGLTALVAFRGRSPTRLFALLALELAICLVPLPSYLARAAAAQSYGSQLIAPKWWNYSWSYLADALGIKFSTFFRLSLFTVCEGFAALFLSRVIRRYDNRPAKILPELVAFAVLSLVAVIELNATSYLFSLLLIVPGIGLIVFNLDRYAENARLRVWQVDLAGIALAVSLVFLGWPQIIGLVFPTAALGVLILAGLLGFLACTAQLQEKEGGRFIFPEQA